MNIGKIYLGFDMFSPVKRFPGQYNINDFSIYFVFLLPFKPSKVTQCKFERIAVLLGVESTKC